MAGFFFGTGIYTIIKLQLSENSYSDPLQSTKIFILFTKQTSGYVARHILFGQFL